MQCTECSADLVAHGATMEALVGFASPRGHNHDDNCQIRIYTCANGHSVIISRQRTCFACDWRGKMTCLCHSGEKVEKWPTCVVS